MTGIREKECTGFRRMNAHSQGQVTGVHPPFQMESNHVVDQNVMTDWKILFVCVEVLRPSQPNGVMSSAVSLPNHTFTGQA